MITSVQSYLSVNSLDYKKHIFPQEIIAAERSKLVVAEYIAAFNSGSLTPHRDSVAKAIIDTLNIPGNQLCAVVAGVAINEAIAIENAIKQQQRNFKYQVIAQGVAITEDLETAENCLFIVVGKLHRSQSLTRWCNFFDIRACYSSKFQYQKFKQDVGHCAGYVLFALLVADPYSDTTRKSQLYTTDFLTTPQQMLIY